MLYCTKHSGSLGLVYLPHWHTAVYMEKTEGCHAFPELSASHCDNSVFLETEACKKGAKETQNSNFLGLHCILYKRMKPALVIWNFVLILFKYSCISFFFLPLCAAKVFMFLATFGIFSLSCDYCVLGKLLYDGLCDRLQMKLVHCVRQRISLRKRWMILL